MSDELEIRLRASVLLNALRSTKASNDNGRKS
jgi:hypothetical protein